MVMMGYRSLIRAYIDSPSAPNRYIHRISPRTHRGLIWLRSTLSKLLDTAETGLAISRVMSRRLQRRLAGKRTHPFPARYTYYSGYC